MSKKTISPLRRLLMSVGIGFLFDYLHQMHIRYTLIRDAKGVYHMKIMREGMLQYHGSSNKSAQSAVADALTSFLSTEQKDFHFYEAKPSEWRESDDAFAESLLK